MIGGATIRAVIAAAAALALLVLIGIGGCDAVRDARAARKQAERERTADRNLGRARQVQEAAIITNRKEVDDATAPIPDQPPSARQRARACVELRRQGGSAPPPC
jgi:hypothetical protein